MTDDRLDDARAAFNDEHGERWKKLIASDDVQALWEEYEADAWTIFLSDWLEDAAA